MIDPRPSRRLHAQVLATPADDLTVDLLRLVASGVALGMAVFLTLVR